MALFQQLCRMRSPLQGHSLRYRALRWTLWLDGLSGPLSMSCAGSVATSVLRWGAAISLMLGRCRRTECRRVEPEAAMFLSPYSLLRATSLEPDWLEATRCGRWLFRTVQDDLDRLWDREFLDHENLVLAARP